MRKLIGKKINAIYINSDQTLLRFKTDKGEINYLAWGDCCSESWFADITGVDALIGGTVISVRAVNMDGYNVDDGRADRKPMRRMVTRL